MELKMELMLVLCVIPAVIESITISSNGNSPKVKMVGGVMVDVQKGFVPMTPMSVETTTEESNYEKSRQFNINATQLSLNERYRRLIPYMTFYYANDLATPIIDSTKSVEVEKAQIVEAKEVTNQRQPKKIFYSPRNIPRFHGNRLTQYNIASGNPTKIYYKDGVPVYQSSSKVTSNYNPLYSDVPLYEYDTGRIVHKLSAKSPGFSYTGTTKRPYLNLYNEESPNIRYYLSGKEQSPKYKLVPYEQTPPINVPQTQSSSKGSYEHIPGKLPYEQVIPVKTSYEQSPLKAPVESPVKVSYESKLPPIDHIYETRKPVIVSVLVPKELYVKPRPVRPSFIYDNGNSHIVRKQPAIISESYYEKKRPSVVVAEPVVESGFRPIVSPGEYSTEAPAYTSTLSQAPIDSDYEIEKQTVPFIESSPIKPEIKPNYYQYVIDQPVHNPSKQTVPSAVTLASLLNSLQVNKSIPKPITRENIAASIRTLLQVLNTLKAAQNAEPTSPVLSTPKPFVASKVVKLVRPEAIDAPTSEALDPELHEEPYLAHVSTPSQHLEDDEHALFGGTSQQFPLPVTSDDEGGTPGRPGVDYPVLTTIPPTSFDCKSQRYKGFFADTETRCQVWHYCDLNGGQASFLCPNGTIFSQAGLTCDWWFNVRCDSTTQLYVLNESLYKYILPHSPKFPEDYSGPLVDKYLTLKFKEMEEELKKNKNKKEDKDSVEDEDLDDEEEDSVEATNDADTSSEMDKRQLSDLSEASVIVESPGSSGKVERLEVK